MDYKKLYKSLEFIKKTCEEYQNNESCMSCPMGNAAGACCLGRGRYPSEWELEEPKTVRMIV